MKELTQEDRIKVMAMYMPCLAMHGKDGPYAIQGVSLSEGMGLFEWDDDSDWWNIDESVKIILSPLSEISDEHAIELARILGAIPSARHELRIDAAWFEDGKFYISLHGWPEVSFALDEMTIEAADYLRSMSYHVPYKGHDLHAAGIAVLPKTDGI